MLLPPAVEVYPSERVEHWGLWAGSVVSRWQQRHSCGSCLKSTGHRPSSTLENSSLGTLTNPRRKSWLSWAPTLKKPPCRSPVVKPVVGNLCVLSLGSAFLRGPTLSLKPGITRFLSRISKAEDRDQRSKGREERTKIKKPKQQKSSKSSEIEDVASLKLGC